MSRRMDPKLCAARGHGERYLRMSFGIFMMPEGVPAPEAPPSGPRWVCIDCGEDVGEGSVLELVEQARAAAAARGARWEAAIVEALDRFERLIERVEAGLDAGEYTHDYRARGETWAALKLIAERLTYHLEHCPGPDELPDDRVHVIGPRAQALGSRCVACMTKLTAEVPS